MSSNDVRYTFTSIQAFDLVIQKLKEQLHIEERMDQNIGMTIQDLETVRNHMEILFERYYQAMNAIDKVYHEARDTSGNALASKVIYPTRSLLKDYHHSLIYSTELKNNYVE
ncbi:hypothetical protein GCM10023310_69170 [Paenibacillus vulneris]|uniref:LXG domain-containing protein n=1 Tax=Paenibacillus vulneris TaxID=1133364 RepID=A0ABW3UH54_9BACL